VEYANNRLIYSLENRAKTIDALLHEWKSDLLRIWIPLVTGAAVLIALFSGMKIQGCRDSILSAAAIPAPKAVQTVAVLEPQAAGNPGGSPIRRRQRAVKAMPGVGHERY
jgi:hypothetical protein